MRRSIVRAVVLIVSLGLCLSGLAVADPAPPSNAANISGGIFKEANDQYLSVNDFTDLESHVVFLQFDMPSGALNGQGFEIGGSAELAGMYVAGYLNSVVPGVTGNLGVNDSQTITIDQDFIIDGGGLITGKTEARSVSVDYNVDSLNDFRALAGLGPLGVGLRILQDASNNKGNLVPSATFAGAATWNDIAVLPVATANSVTTTDTAAAIVAVNQDAFGLGTLNDQTLDFTVSVGTPLALGESLALDVGGDLLVGFRNEDSSALRETYARTVGASTGGAFTPARTLDGSTPAEITDLTSYNFTEVLGSDSHMAIAPSVFANVEMPLNEIVTGMGGIDLGVSLPIYSARYNDAAGAEQRVSGRADSYYTQDVLRVVNLTDPGLTQQTTTTRRGWEAEDVSEFSISVDLSAGVEVVPNDRFRFGVKYVPMVMYTTSTSRHSGQAVETVVVDNGDGANGPGDSVTVSTINRSGFTETTKTLNIDNRVNTAAQFFLIPERLRVNLGAQVDNSIVAKTLADTVTDGILEYIVETAVDTTDTAATLTQTSYDRATEVRDTTDDSQILTQAGSSSLTYDAGLTFFFDENMYLDLRMDAGGGDFWSTGEWSLEMTILY